MIGIKMLATIMSGRSGNSRKVQLGALCSVMFFYVAPANAEPEHELGGKVRTRYVSLESDGISGRAASILFRGNVESTWNRSFSSFVELDYVAAAFEDDYSSGLVLNEKPLFQDVRGDDVNQLWLAYEHDLATVKFGRQAINLDDQRFVSSVSFWQNEQTFDALSLDAPILSSSTIRYSYIANANRIFGDDADEGRDVNTSVERPKSFLGDHEHDTHLVHFEMNEWDFTRWVVYAYFIENKDLKPVSNNTFGSRYEVKFQPGNFRYHIEAEAARQERTQVLSEPSNNYARFFLGVSYSSFEVSGKYEYLGSQRVDDAFVGLVTPIGSTNEFQGWSDGINSLHGVRGVEDTSVKVKWRNHPWKFDLRYHWFSDTESSIDYGSEIDLDISFDITRHHEIHLRVADFIVDDQAKTFLVDKRFASLSYTFEF